MKRREWTLVGACGDTTPALLPPPGGGFAGVRCTLADGLGAVVAMFTWTTRLRPMFRSGPDTGCKYPGRRPGSVTRELPAARRGGASADCRGAPAAIGCRCTSLCRLSPIGKAWENPHPRRSARSCRSEQPEEGRCASQDLRPSAGSRGSPHRLRLLMSTTLCAKTCLRNGFDEPGYFPGCAAGIAAFEARS